MADFTVEGIITVDSSRGIRAITRTQAKLKSLVRDLRSVDREIKKLENRQVNIDVDVNTEAIDRLKEDLDTIHDETVKVKAKATGTEKVLSDMEQLEADIRAISDDDVETKVVLAGGSKALAEAEKLHAELEALARPVDMKIKADVSQFSEIKAGALKAAQSINAPGFSLVSAIAAIAPALIPLGAVVTGVMGGMIGSFSTAALGVGAFGALAIPTIKEIADGVKLLNTDVSKLDPDKLKELQKQLAQLKKTNPLIYKAAQGFMKLKKEYMDAAKQLRPDILKGANKGLDMASYLLGQLLGIAKQAAPAIVGLIGEMDDALRNSYWRAFFRYVRFNTGFFIKTWGRSVGNFIAGIANMIRALNPLSRWFSKGLLGYSRDFRRWTEGLANDPGFQAFVKYVKKSGPEVAHFIGGVIDVFIQLVKALAPLGDKVLAVVNQVLDLYLKFRKANPELADFLTYAGLAAVILSPFASTLFSVGSALAGLIGPWGVVAALAGGFILAIAFLDKKTKSYSGMMKEFKGMLSTAGDVIRDIAGDVKYLWQQFEKAGGVDQLQQALGNIFAIIKQWLPVLRPIADLIGGLLLSSLLQFAYALNITTKAIRAWTDFIAGIVHKVVGFFKWLYDVLIGHSIIPDLINGIANWFRKLVGMVMGPVHRLRGLIVGAWNFIKNKSAAVWGAIAGTVRNKISAAKSFVSGGVGKIKGAISSGWKAITGATSKAWSSVSSYVKNKISDAKAALASKVADMKTAAKNAWNDIKSSAGSILSGVKGKITGAFSGAAGWLTGAGSSIISGLAAGIRSGISKYLGGAMSSVSGFIKSHLPGSPVKRGPLKVLNHGYAGKQITKMLADGIREKKSYLRRTVNDVASAAKLNGAVALSTRMNGSMNRIQGGATAGRRPGRVHRTYSIKVDAALGSNPIEIGRQIVEAVNAFESAGGAEFDNT